MNFAKAFFIFIAVVVLFNLSLSGLANSGNEGPWVKKNTEAKPTIRLQFFWSKTCRHCQKAKPFLKKLEDKYDWLKLVSYEISESEDNALLLANLLENAGEKRFGVPAFLFCGKILLGYENDQSTGTFLNKQILACRESILSGIPDGISETGNFPEEKALLNIPFFGDASSSDFSLPMMTIIIAGLDAFNPCAFFVLLLLLSLLVTVKSRKKMLLVGGIFVFFSGLIYFLFMAAWLNLFLRLGELKIITVLAGVMAISVSAINIKDFFFFKRGITLSMPEKAKPNLYRKMRGLIGKASLPSMILGVITLAIAANSYELLCTSGFPMVYTRILTMNDLSTYQYYMYLIFYNVIYIIPLMVIVLIFVATLGSRKLSENEGRILKLTSGLMMLELGLLLLIAPELLSHLAIAFALIAGSVILTFLFVYLDSKNSRIKFS